MARLIVKSPYIKGGGGGYLKYIATREGVEMMDQQPSGYMEYMAERPRSHGLFGDEDNIDLAAAMKEVNKYPGNIWTHIISLKREDAERLGYDHAGAWRNLLRAHRNDIAAAMHIPPNDFRWYAAFHDEGDHPHVHMMAWSAKPGQAYLSRDGIKQIKSALTNDIFQQEMLHVYEQKSATRDELVRQSKQAVRELTRQMREGVCDSPTLEQQMVVLAEQLETVTGKKKYGYLPKRVKDTANKIVDEVEALPVVNECYQTWWELQCQIEDFYSEQDRKRPRLSERKEFRTIKNMVIREAERLRQGQFTFEDEKMKDAAGEDDRDQTIGKAELLAQYRKVKAILYDKGSAWAEKEVAVQTLERLYADGLTVAAHQLGKCWRDGLGVFPDDEQAEKWFRLSAEAGNDFSQYALGKLLQEQGRMEEAVGWYEKASAQKNQYASYRLGKLYLTGEDMPKDADRAVKYLTASAKAGNQYAQYVLGKLYLEGQGITQDREAAYVWFSQSAAQGNPYAQFFLDRWDTMGQPSVMLSVTRLLHHMSRIFRDTPLPQDATTMRPHMDRKRVQKLNELKQARGQRIDDHSDHSMGGMGGMTMSGW